MRKKCSLLEKLYVIVILKHTIRDMLIQLGILWLARLVFCCNHFGDFCDSAEEGEGGVWPTEQVQNLGSLCKISRKGKER